MAQVTNKNTGPLIKNKLSKSALRERDNEMVRGRFSFLEIPGGTLTFPFRKYGTGKDIKQYSLKDGQIYTLPRAVAKHLATSGSYPIHEYATDATGRPVVRIGRMKKRYNFESLEFFDDLDNTPNLYTVEKL